MYAHSLNQFTRMAVWHITEPESFFSSVVTAGKEIAHPHKRLQHLCGRYLLQHLVPFFPLKEVVAEQNNKPFLPGHPYHFSISHCDDYAAAIVSSQCRVGIDIETVEDRLFRLRKKFLSSSEEALLAESGTGLSEIQKLTLAWSVKESLFKWLGESGVEFKKQLVLKEIQGKGTDGLIVAEINRNNTTILPAGFTFLNEMVLTWIAV